MSFKGVVGKCKIKIYGGVYRPHIKVNKMKTNSLNQKKKVLC